MTDEGTVTIPASELAAMRAKLDEILALIRPTASEPKPIPQDALSVGEFLAELSAAGVQRERRWLYRQIRLRRLKTLPVGRPHRIPRIELLRLTTPKQR